MTGLLAAHERLDAAARADTRWGMRAAFWASGPEFARFAAGEDIDDPDDLTGDITNL